MFFIFQQITGINVPRYYGPHLLGSLFTGSSAKVAKTIAGVEVTSIMTVINVAATYLAFRFINRIGRRKLAMGGFIGMAVFALVSAMATEIYQEQATAASDRATSAPKMGGFHLHMPH